ncbi:MAG: J domain-containing protein [Vicinamibacterales bacterium]
MKDYYALLSVEPDATVDDIKRAFRREIARYHPDKVHHLGQEFQSLAAERAAELTEAYRVLMDPGLRSSYDGERGVPGAAPPRTAHAEPPPAEPARETPPPANPAAPPPPPRAEQPRPAAPPQARDHFMRRMALGKFRDAIERALDGVTSMPAKGFEASYLVTGKRSLFGKAVPERVLTSYVGTVTGAEVTNLGQQALAARGAVTAVTVFALGDSFGPAPDISSAVTTLKKKVPAGVALTIVPVDVRDWTPMMPKDASANARAVIAKLTAKD